MRKYFLITALLMSCFATIGQDKPTINELVIWNFVGEQIKFSDKWSLGIAGQYRHFADRQDGFHIFGTIGGTYQIGEGFSVAGGFTNLNINREGTPQNVLQPELRPFQTLQYVNRVSKLSFGFRFMSEQRYFRRIENQERADGYNFNWRFRHRIRFLYALTDRLSAEISSEVMIQSGEIIVENAFDQHRTVLQLNYKVGTFKLHAGYMHWYFKTPQPVFQNRHTLLLGLTHQLDLTAG